MGQLIPLAERRRASAGDATTDAAPGVGEALQCGACRKGVARLQRLGSTLLKISVPCPCGCTAELFVKPE